LMQHAEPAERANAIRQVDKPCSEVGNVAGRRSVG